ncbi:MAG: rhomboid family intramembrane serine protease [Chloroflexota bacterium]|nr:rhomboid family intramembrane serine protease [Chloroflexota bacterium]
MSTPSDKEHPLYEKPKGQERLQISASQAGKKRSRRPPEDQPKLTLILVAINALIFAAMMVSAEIERAFMAHGALFPPLVVYQGQVYRLFTAMFLHGGLAHVLFNMYALYIIGSTVEPIFGRLRFSLIYFLGGLTGSALSLALGDPLTPSVGASGAVFAIFAAEAAHLYQHRGVYANVTGRLRHMLFLIGMNLVIGFLPGSRIDNWGHIGGVIGGLMLAWRIAPRLSRPVIPPRSMREFARSDSNPVRTRLPELVIYVFVLIGLIVAAISALPAQMPNFVP